jgi:predicted AAA+ superfamily ATPase
MEPIDGNVNVCREFALAKVRPFYNDEQIKLIYGMRRSGKSILLRQIIAEIGAEVSPDHIIYCNLESLEYYNMLDAVTLNEYIESEIIDNSKYYIFFDEIQVVEDFERVLNSLRSTQNVSIFATGSNGKLLSGDLATLLSGRYVKFEIQPFSFDEAIEFVKPEEHGQTLKQFFQEYLQWGALPHRFEIRDEPSVSGYLSDVYESIASRDIIQRAKIRNIPLFNDIFRFTLENVGNLFSLKKMTNYLSTIGRKTSSDTIYEYLDATCAAMLIHRVERYNIAGKGIMANLVKYYATDLGIMQIKAAKNKLNKGALLENIVYNELNRRGYEVYVGHLDAAEIDFVAMKHGETEYYQVAHLLVDDDAIEREFGAFGFVKDNYPKYVISADEDDLSRDGVQHRNIIDWLLDF